MAVQQRRTSKTRKRLRRTHFKLQVSGLITCANCGALIKSHHVCPKCHFYAGKLVVAEEAKKEEETAKKATKTKTTKAKKAEVVEAAPVKEEKKAVKKTTKKAVKAEENKVE